MLIFFMYVLIHTSENFVDSSVAALPQLQALWTDGHKKVLLRVPCSFINATLYTQQDLLY